MSTSSINPVFLQTSQNYEKFNIRLKAEEDRTNYKKTTKALKPLYVELLNSCNNDLIIFVQTLQNQVDRFGPGSAKSGEKSWSQKFLEKGIETAKKHLGKTTSSSSSSSSITPSQITASKIFINSIARLIGAYEVLKQNPLYPRARAAKHNFKKMSMDIIQSSSQDISNLKEQMTKLNFSNKAITKFSYYANKVTLDQTYGTKEELLQKASASIQPTEEKKS